jgi:Fe-Mn family superoxide dismutase
MSEHYPFENKPLPYKYDALEPYIDEKTMYLHHDKHLQTYIHNLNNALRDHSRLQKMTLEQLILISGKLPENVGLPIWRNAGGVYNHRFYFQGMTPSSTKRPLGALAEAIDKNFGSFENFRKKFTDAAMSVFGSGYAWLVSDGRGNLNIMTTPNQDTPLPDGLCPILNIDVWEHAYYLKNYNKRDEYIGNWWHVVNWLKANERYLICKKG